MSFRKRFVDTFDERQRMGYCSEKNKEDRQGLECDGKLEESLRIFYGEKAAYI